MITKRRLILIFGILIVLNSILFGLPFLYESSLNILLGLGVVVVGVLIGREQSKLLRGPKRREKATDVYEENQPDETHVSQNETL